MRKFTHGFEVRLKLATVNYLLEKSFSPLTIKYTTETDNNLKLSFTNRPHQLCAIQGHRGQMSSVTRYEDLNPYAVEIRQYISSLFITLELIQNIRKS